MLGGAVAGFHLLNYGLALVLVFVGLKMAWLNGLFGGKFPITVSLAIVAALSSAGIVRSLVIPPPPARRGERPTLAGGRD